MNARISPMTLISSSPSPASAQSGLDLAAANTWLAMHPTLPLPGRGNTLARWRILANIAAADLCVAKLLEAHYDAQAICADLGSDLMQPGQCWAVWAAEPPGTDMHFTNNALHGTKAWCSGAAHATHALVTAPHQGAPGLFAVALDRPGVRIDASAWQALGMRAIETANVTFSATPAQLVAANGGYLARPGFWHGGAGIAACWFGATTAVADVLRQSPRVRRDPHAAAHLGAIDTGLASTRALMRELAARIDAQPHLAHQREVMQLRSSVEAIARDTVDRVARALGPGPLCMQGAHAQRCADLLVFIRQHHAERDLQSLGERCHQEAAAWTL